MRNLLFFITMALFYWSIPTATIQAQNDQPTFLIVDYMKAKPGMNADYVKLEKVWKKLHDARVKAGKVSGWALLEVVSPYGTSTSHNYVTVQLCKGEDQLNAYFDGSMMDDVNVLSKDDMAMAEKTEQYRDMVSSEVWLYQDGIPSKNWGEGTVQVFNFFALPEGKTTTDHVNMEKKIWMPLHQARIDDNRLGGWEMYSLMMPMGSGMPYADATIDYYDNMKQFLSDPEMVRYFEKVHEGRDMDKLWAITSSTADLTIGEVRRVIASVGF
jgi:hypothetical protein